MIKRRDLRKKLFFAAILVFYALSSQADILVGRVVRVTDRDTITLLDNDMAQHKIRLSGIDAPEKKQPFGQRAKDRLSELVAGKSVEVSMEKKDRYGRIVGKILVEGRDVNLAMMVSGFAWHYKKYQVEQSSSDRLLYDSAEQDARIARRGLWADPTPIAPWLWRAGTSKQSQGVGTTAQTMP